MNCARLREVARSSANHACHVVDAIRHRMGESESGTYNDAITKLADAIQSLATAVDLLADVSEEQDNAIRGVARRVL